MKILLCNAHYSEADGQARNNGDAALLAVAAQWFTAHTRSSAIELAHGGSAVHSGIPGYRSTSLQDRAGLFAAVSRADLVFVTGGTVLADDQPGSAFRGHPRMMATLALMARATRTPMTLIGVGAEPATSPLKRNLLSFATRSARVIAARDERSRTIIRDRFGSVAEPLLGGDLFWLRRAPGEPVTNEGTVPAGDRRIVYALRGADCLTLIERGDLPANCVLLSMDATDVPSALARSGHPLPAGVAVVVPRTWREALTTISNARYVVASRMHALYFAADCAVPAIAVATIGKVRSFAEEFGLPSVDGAAAVSGAALREVTARLADEEAVQRARRRAHDSVRSAVMATPLSLA